VKTDNNEPVTEIEHFRCWHRAAS